MASAAIGVTSAAAATITQPASGGAAMQATVRTAGTLTRPSTINQLGGRILRPGLHGNDVTVLQGYLTIAGYPTSVDGAFGPDTGSSVAAFKLAHQIAPANDVAGPSFDAALKAAISAQESDVPTGTTRINAGRNRDRTGRRAGPGADDGLGRQLDPRHVLLRGWRSRHMELELL